MATYHRHWGVGSPYLHNNLVDQSYLVLLYERHEGGDLLEYDGLKVKVKTLNGAFPER